MANEAENLRIQKTIRDYLLEMLKNQGDTDTGTGVQLVLDDGNSPVYDVDLIWNGQQYLIAYKEKEDDSFPHIDILENRFPITFRASESKATTS